jgi:hypothetical protein
VGAEQGHDGGGLGFHRGNKVAREVAMMLLDLIQLVVCCTTTKRTKSCTRT